MTTFAEHLEATRQDDGNYDLAAAVDARAAELVANPEDIARLARKAAQSERRSWESSETANLRKMFLQPALSPELELDLKVPLGDNVARSYGEMDHEAIRLRRDMREENHRREFRAYDTEIEHWRNTERLLPAGQTIRQALGN